MSQRTQSFDAELAELAELDRRNSDGAGTADGASADGGAKAGGDSAAMPTTRLGRFALLELLGEGGMGSVYAAYDPSLDRKVALKLVRYGRQTSVSRDRMVREAQALARLSHPNVVAVHEVGTFADQLFLVMEFVRGQTLDEWSRAERRGWREVVAAYAQVARGLSAAHAAGLVHRDVKPNNLIIGDDGRVRLIDFGLARRDDVSGEDRGAAERVNEEETSAEAPSDRPTSVAAGSSPASGGDVAYADTTDAAAAGPAFTPASQPGLRDGGSLLASERRLTIPGARLGTPGYMAPEQIAGGELGPATDQFALCVALWEALYGARPFDAPTLDQQLEQMARGDIATPPAGQSGSRAVPRHIEAAVRRGLAYAARDRFPSLDALVAELARDPARTRRRFAVAAAGLVGALGLGAVAATSVDRGPSCDLGDGRAADIWNEDSRKAVSSAVAALPAGAEVWALVEPRLDGYVSRWKLMHRQACVAHNDGSQSDRLFDARMRCLERRYNQIGAAVGILREPRRGESEVNAARLVAGLEPVEACADLEALSAAVPPPESAQQRTAVEAVEARLDENAVTEAAGFSVNAMETARTLVTDADAIGYQPLVAEANLQLGRAAIGAMRVKESIAPLERSLNAALAVGARDFAAEAQVRLLWALANQGRWDRDDLDRGARLAEALVAAASPPVGLESLMHKNVGESLIARGDKDAARERLGQALASRPPLSSSRYATDLATVTTALAFASTDSSRRQDLLERAVRDLETLVGKQHAMTLQAVCALGIHERDSRESLTHLRLGTRGYRKYAPQELHDRALCELTAAEVAADLGRNTEARAMYESAAQLYRDIGTVEARQTLAEGYAFVFAERPDRALQAFERSSTEYRSLQPEKRWWIRLELAHAELGAGLALTALNRPRAALARLSEAVASFDRLAAVAPVGPTSRSLARARLAFARAAAAAGETQKAAEALDAAEAWYRDEANNEFALAQLTALRDELE